MTPNIFDFKNGAQRLQKKNMKACFWRSQQKMSSKKKTIFASLEVWVNSGKHPSHHQNFASAYGPNYLARALHVALL